MCFALLRGLAAALGYACLGISAQISEVDIHLPDALACDDRREWASFRRAANEHAALGWPGSRAREATAAEEPGLQALKVQARGLVDKWLHVACSDDCRFTDDVSYRFIEEIGSTCSDSAHFDRYIVTHYFRNRGFNFSAVEASDYCHYGFVTALVVSAQFEFATSVAHAQRFLFIAFILLGDFYMFDWLESSGWPVTSLMVTLNLYLMSQKLLVGQDLETSRHSFPGEAGPAALWAHLAWQGTSEAGKQTVKALDPEQLESRPRVVIWQFDQHTSLAGEAKTMLTRFSSSTGVDVQFLGNSIAFSVCGNYGLCGEHAFAEIVQGFLDRYKKGEGFESVAEPFARALEPRVRQADVLMCSQPISWCRFLLRLGMPIFFYAGLPVMWDVREEDQPAWAREFTEILVGQQHVVVAMSVFHARLMHWQFGVRVPAQTVLGLHTGAAYAPFLKQSVLVSRFGTSGALSECMFQRFVDANKAWFPIHFRQLESILFENQLDRSGREDFNGVKTWGDHTAEIKVDTMPFAKLASHLAAVFLPYDTNIFMFNELYAIGIPLFVPRDLWKWTAGLQTIPSMGYRTDWELSDVARVHGPGRQHRPPTWSPFYLKVQRPIDIESAYAWAVCSDWALLPHIRYFRGVPDLFAQLMDAEALHRTAAGMKAFNEEALVAAVGNWRRVAHRLVFASRLGALKASD